MAGCCKYHAGMLRHRIRLASLRRDAGDHGGYAETPVVYAVARAALEFKSGRRGERGGYEEIKPTLQAVLRFRPDLQESHVVIDAAGVVYRITALDNVKYRRRWLVLTLSKAEGHFLPPVGLTLDDGDMAMGPPEPEPEPAGLTLDDGEV